MNAASKYKIRQCTKCTGDTEYVCKSCPCDLCLQCTVDHVRDFTTVDHDVVIYRDTLNYIPNQNTCVRHVNTGYGMYCQTCDSPACSICLEHKEHRLLDVRTEYESKRQRLKEIIHIIKSDTFSRRSAIIIAKIKADFKVVKTSMPFYKKEIVWKANRLKNFIDRIQDDFEKNVFCEFDTKHRCLKQKFEMISHLSKLQKYENMHVQSAINPIQFLLSKNRIVPTRTREKHTSQISMTHAINKEMVTQLLTQIKLEPREKRRINNKSMLKLMPGPEFHKSLRVTDVDCCYHISRVTSDLFWVSCNFKLLLTDATGESLHCRKDLYSDLSICGSHTVNKDGDLIFIDRELDIIKVSKDMNTTKIFIKWNFSSWKPLCVYFSASTGDLLVGVYDRKSKRGGVHRYNPTGDKTHTIEHNSEFLPHLITENNNGVVVVSDAALIVATDSGGMRRFSYTGHPNGSGLLTQGLSTDALSHILVCDGKTHTVQLINEDGQFLSHLLIRPFGIFEPCSLSYDVNTHRLKVGSIFNNKVCVYKYITRNDALNDSDLNSPNINNGRDTETHQEGNLDEDNLDSVDLPKTNHTIDEKTIHKGNPNTLKISPPRLIHSITVTGIYSCYHISFVKPNMMWVSDANNLILTNGTGDILHQVTDLSSMYNGIHTVNSENELIYISDGGDIKKISKDMKKTSFIEKSEKSTPQCVYWSSSTEDLLIGIRSRVSRYNLKGLLTQTIQYDEKGELEIYCDPNCITENNNRDIIVSDYGAVVVTESGGRHRFSYTGYPSGSGLDPRGICTDTLSRILVCDCATKTVHMLDKNGEFLSYLLARGDEIDSPYSLSYDVNRHHLYVGSDSHNKNTVHVYKFEQDEDFPYECDVMFGSTPA